MTEGPAYLDEPAMAPGQPDARPNDRSDATPGVDPDEDRRERELDGTPAPRATTAPPIDADRGEPLSPPPPPS